MKAVKKWATFHVLKASDGGPGYSVIDHLKEIGIRARKAPVWCGSTSGYVGHVAIMVPEEDERRASKEIFG